MCMKFTYCVVGAVMLGLGRGPRPQNGGLGLGRCGLGVGLEGLDFGLD